MDPAQTAAPAPYHVPVMLQPVLDALDVKPTGCYIDGTAGGGGHSFAIASRLTTGRLIAMDRDPDAIAQVTARLAGLPVTVVHDNFTAMDRALAASGGGGADGVLMDLGVSSHQLDAAERGFSYHRDAPLDMRMSQTGPSAADLLATCDEAALADILFRYGEERYARMIARAIVVRRDSEPVRTTGQLADCVAGAVPAKYRRDAHPARRTFQALRIAVNGELDCLTQGLQTAFSCLVPGGRLAVITFHSLEDRIVKQQFSAWCTGCTCPPDFPVCVCGKQPQGRLVLRKPVEATPEEVAQNPRSRSARLRCVERL